MCKRGTRVHGAFPVRCGCLSRPGLIKALASCPAPWGQGLTDTLLCALALHYSCVNLVT